MPGTPPPGSGDSSERSKQHKMQKKILTPEKKDNYPKILIVYFTIDLSVRKLIMHLSMFSPTGTRTLIEILEKNMC